MVNWLVALISILIGIGFVIILVWSYLTVEIEAQGECELPIQELCDAGEMMGFPAGWLTISGIISYIICPGFLTLIVFYMFSRAICGWLSDSSKVHFGLAFVVGLMLTFGRVFQKFVFAMYTSLGIIAAYATGVIGLVAFIFALKNIGFGGGFKTGKIVSQAKKAYDKEEKRIKDEIKECKEKKKDIDKRIKELGKKFSKVTRSAYIEQQFDQLTEIYENWHDKEERLKQELKDLKESEKETVKEIKEEAND